VGRTDQVPFVSLGIPGYGVLGAYDSTPTENPYPWWYKHKPPISGSAVLPVLKGAAAEADRLTRGFVCGLSGGR